MIIGTLIESRLRGVLTDCRLLLGKHQAATANSVCVAMFSHNTFAYLLLALPMGFEVSFTYPNFAYLSFR